MSGSYDGTVRLWDAVTGVALQTLEGHSSLVTSKVSSPDGKEKPALYVSNDWVMKRKKKNLWLPPDYRATCEAVQNEVIVFRTLIRENICSRI